MNNTIENLKQWVKENYSPTQCGWTADRSRGHSDDCFEDGEQCGTSWAAYTVGGILGMKLEEPDEQEFE